MKKKSKPSLTADIEIFSSFTKLEQEAILEYYNLRTREAAKRWKPTGRGFLKNVVTAPYK